MPTVDRFELRPGVPNDTDALVRISTGPIDGKRSFIADSFGRRAVVVAVSGERVVGYVIWDRTFFSRPFVWLIGVDPAFRGRGIASRLLHAFESDGPDEGHFTSTNESNRTMQAILERRGFVPSGRLENIDPGDAELFYYRAPGPGPGADRAPEPSADVT